MQYFSSYCLPQAKFHGDKEGEGGVRLMRSMTQVGPSLDNDQTEEVGEYGDGDIVELTELLENFKPEQNHIDRMLLYQITGKELD